MNKLWKKFDHLTQTCYSNMARGISDINSWNTGFDLLQEIISNGRAGNPDFAKELYLLDDETDYSHDVQGWLEDYLDELDMHEMYPELETVCRKLLKLFAWREEYPSEIRFLLASALGNQGKIEEAYTYINQAIKNISPTEENASIYEHAGDILSVKGETEKALEMWKKAQSLNSDSKTLKKKIKHKKYIAQ